MGLLVLVWFVALHGHTAGSGSGGSPASVSAPSASSPASNPAAPTSVYHGKAPGVEGLTRAIDKAHGAVAQSQQNDKQLQEKSAQASSQGAQGTTQASGPAQANGSVAGAQVNHSATTKAPARTVTQPVHPASKPSSTKAAGASPALPPRQVTVEKELKQGEVVVLLFWSRKGADDVAVHSELRLLLAAHRQIRASDHLPLVRRLVKAVGLELDKKIAVHYASASQVASFGSFTRTVQVYQTPTIVIVNKKGKTRTLTGLADAYSIEQTIDEARHS
jgi:hypothetical protein